MVQQKVRENHITVQEIAHKKEDISTGSILTHLCMQRVSVKFCRGTGWVAEATLHGNHSMHVGLCKSQPRLHEDHHHNRFMVMIQKPKFQSCQWNCHQQDLKSTTDLRKCKHNIQAVWFHWYCTTKPNSQYGTLVSWVLPLWWCMPKGTENVCIESDWTCGWWRISHNCFIFTPKRLDFFF